MKNLLAAALLGSLLLNAFLLLRSSDPPPLRPTPEAGSRPRPFVLPASQVPAGEARLSVSLTVASGCAEAGGDIRVACALRSGAPSPKQWIGLFAIGAHASNHLGYHMVDSLPATFTFKAPRVPGEYELRYVLEDHRTSIAASPPVHVMGIPPSRPVVELQPGATLVKSGQEVQAAWSVLWGERSSSDWIGFFAPGSKNEQFLTWQYVSDADSGRVVLRAPEEPGPYEMRYLLKNGFQAVAVSDQILVVP
ncbi:MAG: hypothetical protein HY293_08130 [Planctomycetes bacterium]|nr:hypothetical protein [Planctomycetota bacterium]